MTRPENKITNAVQPLEAWCGQRSREQLDWAFRAHERFVQSLSDEVRSRLTCKGGQDEAYVVVFGKTQVGKTTLLMDLMGVTPEAMGRVSLVLRGGRPMGKSATATTMEYRRSQTNSWGLTTTDKVRWFSNDEEATQALGELRSQMESGVLRLTNPCIVQIPENYFGPDDGQPRVKMLDLPGDKPANGVEQDYVRGMAKKYVPLADLILLVGRGDDLSFLQPGELTLPGIEDWQSVPGRFRIVTTYSFTAQSVRQQVRKSAEPLTAKIFRQRLIDEIEKFSPLAQEARSEQRFFPLEFGQSWLDARHQQPQLHARLSPLIDDLKKQLHEDIQASTTPIARLRSAVDAHVVIERVKENRLKDMEREAARLQKDLQRAQEIKTQTQSATEEAQRVWENLKGRLDVLTDDRFTQDLEEHYSLDGSTSVDDPDEKVDGFKFCVWQATHSFLRRFNDSRPQGLTSSTAWFWRSVNMADNNNQAREMLENHFSQFIGHLDSYKLNKYWFTSSYDSDYRKDRRMLAHLVESAEDLLTENSRLWWLAAAIEQRKLARKELSKLKREHTLWIRRLEDADHQVRAAESVCEELERLRMDFLRRMNEDLVESRRFKMLLDESYLDELQQRRKTMAQHYNATHVFLELLASIQLGHVRQKLLKQVEADAPAF